MKQTFLVQLLTSRRGYDVAEILHNNNLLTCLVTDFYRNSCSRYLKYIFPLFNYVYNSYNKKLPITLVKKSIWAGILYRLKLKIYPENNYYATLKSYQILAHNSILMLNRNKEIDSIYSYDTGALELFQFVLTHDTNVKKLYLEQCVAPRSSQIDMYRRFSSLYNIDYNKEIESCQKLHQRELKEWAMATKIIVPSDYVKYELIKCGVDEKKIYLVPYGYSSEYNYADIQDNIKRKQVNRLNKIVILYVGNGGYRKGVLDLFEIAKKIEYITNIEFRIAGNMNGILSKIDESLLKKCNIHLLGVLDKKHLFQEYLNADIFILPSYLEGSAMAIQEALSFGLPVITTFESGAFVTDKREGFIFNAGDIDGMSNAIKVLCENEALRYTMANNAVELMQKNTLEKYQQKLLSVLL